MKALPFHPSDVSPTVRPCARRPAPDQPRGFTLIEVIGVLAVIAAAVGVLVPALAQRVSRAKAAADAAEIEAIGEAIVQHASLHQEIPGTDTWARMAARLLGRSDNEIRYSVANDPSTERIYLVHPSFRPRQSGGAGISDTVWSQGTEGTATVQDARILILSVHRTGLSLPMKSGSASTEKAFAAVWDWYLDPSTDAPPSGWPSEWDGNGEYLHVARINLEPCFLKVTFSNSEYPGKTPYIQIGSVEPFSFPAVPAFDSRYLVGTPIRVYGDSGRGAGPGMLQLSHALRSDMNFVYEDDRWTLQ